MTGYDKQSTLFCAEGCIDSSQGLLEMTVGRSRAQDYACLFSTDTKNPSVPVRRGVISQPSGACCVAAANSSGFSHNTVMVGDGGTTAHSGRARAHVRSDAA